jgi:hypothetical protein
MELGICKLCGKEAPLHHSHVIPKFVFRWFKRTSATGFLRSGINPNRRDQDGLKHYWLCTSCEALLNEAETSFANEVFHPLMDGRTERAVYGAWMLKFATSLAWRVALDHLERNDSAQSPISEVHRTNLLNAMTRWKEFLLGRPPHPGEFEQHLLWMGVIDGNTTLPLPVNINRFLLRTIDMTIACGDNNCATYAKFGPFIFFGFVSMRCPREWEGTKLHVKEGQVQPGKVILPGYLWPFLVERAENQARINREISPAQREKINAAYRSGRLHRRNSGTVEAIMHDYQRFGKLALTTLPPTTTAQDD